MEKEVASCWWKWISFTYVEKCAIGSWMQNHIQNKQTNKQRKELWNNPIEVYKMSHDDRNSEHSKLSNNMQAHVREISGVRCAFHTRMSVNVCECVWYVCYNVALNITYY